jgi:hypothetical protein
MKKTTYILILGITGVATSFATLAIERQQSVEYQLKNQQHTMVFDIKRPPQWSIYGHATPGTYYGTLALLFEPTALAP